MNIACVKKLTRIAITKDKKTQNGRREKGNRAEEKKEIKKGRE